MYPFPASRAEVIADNRLGGLGNGITYHKDERKIIATHAESTHSVISQIPHEYMVPDEQ